MKLSSFSYNIHIHIHGSCISQLYTSSHFFKNSFFPLGISCLKLIVVADTRSLIIAYIKELNIRNLYREGKKYRQPIQMYCYSRYKKCSRYSDAFPARDRLAELLTQISRTLPTQVSLSFLTSVPSVQQIKIPKRALSAFTGLISEGNSRF